MSDVDKTVFIGYRPEAGATVARAIFDDLYRNGYDVFMDVEEVDDETFVSVTLSQIKARAHFILVLTTGTVEALINPDDHLRRAIEHAMSLQRNIVPVMTGEFDFVQAERYLTGRLSQLSRFNALRIYHDYFQEALGRLRERYLRQPVYGEVVQPSPAQQQLARQKIEEAADKVRLTTALVFNAEVYLARALTNERRGNLDEALENYTKAVESNPEYAEAYFGQGNVHRQLGNLSEAIHSLTEALRYKPQMVQAYQRRGEIYFVQEQYERALSDLRRANDLRPGDPTVLATLAVIYQVLERRGEAKRLWKLLVAVDERYRDPDWVRQELDWADPLVEVARDVITKL